MKLKGKQFILASFPHNAIFEPGAILHQDKMDELFKDSIEISLQ
jgi:hypothetical protein